ncbi:MAG: 50S ribosomal protein L18e [Nanoarchaeota archaeon]|mgnify:CR=1 FL=1
MKSKTKINKQLQRKTNSSLVETVRGAAKNEKWKEVANILSYPRRQRTEVNLDKLSSESKVGEVVIIPGKVLSNGEINKKIKVAAFSFSQKAREKLLSAGCQVLSIEEEIKNNPEAKGVKILK